MCTDDGQGDRDPRMRGERVVVQKDGGVITDGSVMQMGVAREGQQLPYRQPIIEARMGAGAGWNSPELYALVD